jgi:hypothetical protein
LTFRNVQANIPEEEEGCPPGGEDGAPKKVVTQQHSFFMKEKIAPRRGAGTASDEPLLVSSTIINGREQPLTTAQLASHLQLTSRTIATYRQRRLIPFWRINARNIRYRLSDVERALENLNK